MDIKQFISGICLISLFHMVGHTASFEKLSTQNSPLAINSVSHQIEDQLNRLNIRVPKGWVAYVPNPSALQGATVLVNYPEDNRLNLNAEHEGVLTSSAIKIQLQRIRLRSKSVQQWQAHYLTANAITRSVSAIDADTAIMSKDASVAVVVPLPLRGQDATWILRFPNLKNTVLDVIFELDSENVLLAQITLGNATMLDKALSVLALNLEAQLQMASNMIELSGSIQATVRSLQSLMISALSSAQSQAIQAQSLTVTQPQADDVWFVGLGYDIRWEPAGEGTVDVELLSSDAQTHVLWIATNSDDDGQETWVLPSQGDDNSNLDGWYVVRVTRSDKETADSDIFKIIWTCGTGSHTGSEALSPLGLDLHMPFRIGSRWTVGGGGSFYGRWLHCNRYNDYYATDWNASQGEDAGEAVLAVANGVVTEVSDCSSAFGCSVTLEHPSSSVKAPTYRTQYAHLNAVYVETGQRVLHGQHIGDVGSTGNAQFPHLHFRFLQVLSNDTQRAVSWCANSIAVNCPNGEPVESTQTAKPSPMLTWQGQQSLLDGISLVSENGISVIAPQGGAVLQAGAYTDIVWLSRSGRPISIDLWKQDMLHSVLFSGIVNDGQQRWQIPANIETSRNYRIRIYDSAWPQVEHFSEYFGITGCGVSVFPLQLPYARVAENYQQTLTLLGATPPLQFDLQSGELPAGLVLDSSGILSGVPQQAQRTQFTVRGSDANQCWAERDYNLTVCGDITLMPSELPDATLNQTYSVILSATGGTPPYAFDLLSGQLPDGINLSVHGEIWGAPSLPGVYTFEIGAADANGCYGSLVYTLTVVDFPATEKIVFESSRDNSTSHNTDIFVMNADGSNPINLTSRERADLAPTWSPDGTRIAYESNVMSYDIFVMDADGSNKVNLTNRPLYADMSPAWSPDGLSIAYVHNDNGDMDIYIMNADGSNPVNLSNNPVDDYSPSFSPDGSQIVYESYRNGRSDIYVMDVDGNNVVNLTNTTHIDHSPTWSPDGSLIAFSSEQNGNWDIYVMNTDGSNPVRLTFDPGSDLTPAWSRDGARIAFTSDRDGNLEVYMMNADGSNIMRLTNHPDQDSSPDLSP